MSDCYQNLVAWQIAMDLVVDVYKHSRSFPLEERYGLTAQMRRSAVSVPSNIAEGKGRFSRKELIQFLFHARGSLMELETQIVISARLGYLNDLDSKKLLSETRRLARVLNGLVQGTQNLV
jgi:four helix bundle protein